MTAAEKPNQSEIIPRLYLKLLPVQIILVVIGGANSKAYGGKTPNCYKFFGERYIIT